MTRVQRVAIRYIRQVQTQLPGFELVIGQADPNLFPAPRSMAFCEDATPLRVGYAPKLEHQPLGRIEGVMAHEIGGHAALFALGHKEHKERDADAMAEKLLGIRISYDAGLVQTTENGIRPRPAHLGL